MDGGRSITFCATMEKVDAVQADNGTMKKQMQSKHGTGGQNEHLNQGHGDAEMVRGLSVREWGVRILPS